MGASLVSRELIADSIELVGCGHIFDAAVALAACDKCPEAANPFRISSPEGRSLDRSRGPLDSPDRPRIQS